MFVVLGSAFLLIAFAKTCLLPHKAPHRVKQFTLLDTTKALSKESTFVVSALCAPARIRTWNTGFEDRDDIHFTTRAYVSHETHREHTANWQKSQKYTRL